MKKTEITPLPDPDAELDIDPRRFVRLPGYIIQGEFLPQLTEAELKVLTCICWFARSPRFKAFPGMPLIKRITGLHPETIRKARKRLRSRGLIHFTNAGWYRGGQVAYLASERPGGFPGLEGELEDEWEKAMR